MKRAARRCFFAASGESPLSLLSGLIKTAGLFFIIVLLLPAFLHASFEGFGANTPGGNRGTLVTVTSLADKGLGTLREALSRGDNLRIVFQVSGTIRLQSRLQIKNQSFITIDGSTAPAPGITLENYGLLITKSHDIIVNNIRVRNSLVDGITIKNGSFNVVVDHCSLADSADENISVTEGSHDVTVSWNIIGHTQQNPGGQSPKGMLIANFNGAPVTNVSVHNNLFANEGQRSPQVSTPGLVDIRNNVIWNWSSYGIRMRDGARGNIVNNVFDSSVNAKKAVVLVSAGSRSSGPVYIQGNQGPTSVDIDSLGTAAAAFPAAPVRTDNAIDVAGKVLQAAGSSFVTQANGNLLQVAPILPRDAVDAFLAQNASQTGSTSNNNSGKKSKKKKKKSKK